MKRALRLVLLVTMAACAGAAPRTAATPTNPDAISLRENWRSTVIVERDDSIVLTLPSGGHQLQRFHRVAGFTLAVGGNGTVSIRLDSLKTQPAGAANAASLAGATLGSWRRT